MEALGTVSDEIMCAPLPRLLPSCGKFPAFAHRPYYTQVEKIRLPNGDIGEVRLLNGDEIMVADPVRAVIVDPQNKLGA